MQSKLVFNDCKKIKLKQPINKLELIEAINNYFNKLTNKKVAISGAIETIKSTHDLEKAVDIINSNPVCDCEKEFTELIRKTIILSLFLLALSENAT